MGAFFALAFSLTILKKLTGAICPFNAITGFPCPTCGFTRALVEFFKFNIPLAFTLHPLFWLMGPLVLFIAFLAVFKPAAISKFNWLWTCSIAAIMLCYVLRLIFSFPRFEPMTINEDALLMKLLTLLGLI